MALLAALMASKNAIGGIVTTGALAAAISPALGFDPLTWILGAIGGVVIRVKLPPTTRPDSIANGVISVILAGLGAPMVTHWLSIGGVHANIYLVSFIIAACWPWVLSVGWKAVKSKMETWSKK